MRCITIKEFLIRSYIQKGLIKDALVEKYGKNYKKLQSGWFKIYHYQFAFSHFELNKWKSKPIRAMIMGTDTIKNTKCNKFVLSKAEENLVIKNIDLFRYDECRYYIDDSSYSIACEDLFRIIF